MNALINPYFSEISSHYFSSFLATTTENTGNHLVLAGALLNLIVIYLASKLGGEICIRLNLPPVLGELLGGVVIGVSVLHLLMFPENGEDGSHSLIMRFLQATSNLPQEAVISVFQKENNIISFLSEIGVVILLFEIGLESDLGELLKVGSQAVIVALMGVIIPFLLGTIGLIGLFGMPSIAAVFTGAALTATSIGITAKVLAEMQKLQTKEAQIIIGAAVLDDILGIIVLAVVASLARDGEVDIMHSLSIIINAIIFFVGSIILGRLFNPFFVKLVNNLQTRGQLLLAALVFAFLMAYIAAIIHLEAILGAFAAGLILAETDKGEELQSQVVTIADMLVPIFFVVVGAKTDLSVLNPFIPGNQQGLVLALFLVFVAIISKVMAGLMVFGQPNINRLVIGVGMIPRGEVGLIFASIGASTGILSKPLQAGIIIMVIFTTFLAPLLLRAVFSAKPQT